MPVLRAIFYANIFAYLLIKELGGEIENVSEIEEIEEEEIAPTETQGELLPEEKEIEGEDREDVLEKLEKAIALLQEVAIAKIFT